MAHLTVRRVNVPTVLRAPAQTWFVTAFLIVIGLGLILQSARWYDTPAYGVLLKIFNADAWGIIHLAVAGLMVIGITTKPRWTSVVAHTAALVILGIWDFAFFVRWVTDHATTSVNPSNWTAWLILAGWSATLIDRPRL